MTHPKANPPPRTPPPEDSVPTAPEQTTDQKARARVAVARLAAVVFVGTALWFVPVPAGVQPRAWHLLAVFVATMVGIVLRPIPMGAMAFVAAAFAVLSGTLTISEATVGFGSTVVWLVVAAFFIATAFIKTGLGIRIAYHFMRVLGSSSLGLAYGLVATDLVLTPSIPSNTARAGGVVYPILKSLCTSLGSDAEQGTERRITSFLTFTAYQGVVVTSAMFFTAMAANPLAAELAAQQGVEITWELWALAASVPGALSLLFVPLLIYRLYPPEIKRTPEAPELGLLDWFSDRVSGVLSDGHWLPAFLSLSLIYFYSHYFFASNTAHMSAMYAPFLAVALAVGTPPLLAALVLAFFSNLFASMTHYGTAPAPILFGSGNVALGTWWKLGTLISVMNITIWLGVGSLWWKLLGLW